MLRVYIAGAISDPDPVKMIANIRRGCEAGARLIKQGFTPFIPFCDFPVFLTEEGKDITLKQIQEYSLGWLEVCEVVYVLPNSEHSKGTQHEIDVANHLDIPIVFSEADLWEMKMQKISDLKHT